MSILEELPIGVWVARAPGGELAYANRTFTAILGMEPREDVYVGEYAATYRMRDAAGRPYPEDQLPFVRALQERKTVVVDDIVIERSDGTRVNVRAFGKPLFDAGGSITHVMVAFIDITAQVRAEQAGADARERLRTAIDHAPVILFAVDRDGMVTLSEGAGLRGMGVKPGELVGQNIYEMYADNREVLDGNRRVLAGETINITVDLGHVVLASWLAPLRGEDGSVTGLIGVSTDVTERLRLQQQIAQADRLSALGRLAASVAHEINNPLAYAIEALRLATEVIGETGQDGGAERLRQLLGDAAEGMDRVRLIARDLRVFSRPDEEARGPVSLDRCVANAIKLVAKRAGARAQIELQAGPAVSVRADENRLVQILVNLLMNAADALPAESAAQNRIRLSTRVEDEQAVIDIADNGPGIPSEMRDRIFEPFFTTKPVGEGTGLGLFVTRNLVRALGGTVTLGDTPSGGALFTVRLPVERADAGVAVPAVDPPRAAAAYFRALIIDDDPQVADLLRVSLQRQFPECQAHSFTSGRAAVDHLARGEQYDLIFCDLMMGEISGPGLYNELRRRAPGCERNIIFMTGGVYDPSVTDFLSAIPNDCIDKPFDIRAEVQRRLARPSP